MRWLPLLLLLACEKTPTRQTPTAAPTRQTSSRSKLDTSALPAPLPVRGYAIQAFGIGGIYDVWIVDADARTLRVIVHGDGQSVQSSDQTVPLDAAQVKTLDAMADRAWHEKEGGKAPQAHDIVEDLFIVDHDDGFHLRGYPIEDVTNAYTWRPEASKLVIAIQKLGVPVIEAGAAPKPVTTNNMMPRKSLVTPDTDAKVLPKHGVVVHAWGMAGDTLIVIDQDASTMKVVENLMGKKAKNKTTKLDAKKLERIMTAGLAAAHETSTGPMPQATDIREDLIVLDGDNAFYLTGTPISRLGGDEDTGRPAAATAMFTVYDAAR